MTLLRTLLDTHALLWFLEEDTRLSKISREVISSEDVLPLISLVSIWEMAIKLSSGKLILNFSIETLLKEIFPENKLVLLHIESSHVAQIVNLPLHHRDPFDRMLIAQAMVEDMPIISADGRFDAYAVTRIW
jgi:PIN domain nuclease of toxin-antitoxin system